MRACTGSYMLYAVVIRHVLAITNNLYIQNIIGNCFLHNPHTTSVLAAIDFQVCVCKKPVLDHSPKIEELLTPELGDTQTL